MCIEKNLTRVVRAVGVNESITTEDLKEVAKRTRDRVEHVTLNNLKSGARKVDFRMCTINDALALAQTIRRDPDWEYCNITNGAHPCAVATEPRFSA